MILSKNDLKRYLAIEKKLYLEDGLKKKIHQYISNNYNVMIWRYVKHLRKSEYYYNVKKGLIRAIGFTYHRRVKSKLGLKLGIQMYINNFEEGLKIYHPFSIIINKNAKIGKNCELRGCNCIGNNGLDNQTVPHIGDNVSLGWGSIVYGKIRIPNNVIIGANSVVNRGFDENNIIIAGVPAKKIKNI